ncbi:MAG: response regulator [Polaromonas sp.]|nr:response regulator [Polaromonas sp.]
MKLEPLGNSRIAEILLVDDNEDDVLLTREACDAAGLPRKQVGYLDAYTPDMILLDMPMPVIDGYEVLSEIVKDEKLQYLPAVELSTSYAAADIHRMDGLRCNSYTPEPLDFDNFVKTNAQLVDHWLTLVVTPCGSHPSARVTP